jgi:DNA-binding GntR family transcriptional regulator
VVPSSGIIRGLREQIVKRLRDDILSGRLAEGERLSEPHLAERFGVSRGPIREALLKLTHEGLLVGKPNCGVRVASTAPDSVRQFLIPLRRTIETYALRLCFESLTEEDFQTWEEILQGMERAGRQEDYAALAEQDIAFHRWLLERAGQPDLLAIWSTIVARVRQHFQRVLLVERRNALASCAEHRDLLATFRSGDKEAAIKALEEHIA